MDHPNACLPAASTEAACRQGKAASKGGVCKILLYSHIGHTGEIISRHCQNSNSQRRHKNTNHFSC